MEVDDIVGVRVESRSTLLSGFGHIRTQCARVVSAVLGLLALEKLYSRPWRRGRSVSENSTPVLRVAARATGGLYFWAARTRRPRPGRTHTYWVCSSVLIAKTGGGIEVWRLSWTLRACATVGVLLGGSRTCNSEDGFAENAVRVLGSPLWCIRIRRRTPRQDNSCLARATTRGRKFESYEACNGIS